MPGKQGDITSFFSPKPKEVQKRKIEENSEEKSEACFSPDQKKRMMANKLSAQIKVASKKLPFVMHENIGPSWFSALQKEFDKPYFEKLNSFLQKERNSAVKIFPPHDQVTEIGDLIWYSCDQKLIRITKFSDEKKYVFSKMIWKKSLINL